MIFLVGYRAVGKTTVGRRLAEELNFDFIDLDEWICDTAGRAVSQIVKDEGWQGFREREKEALKQSFKMTSSVVSTGGGAVLHQDIWRGQQPEKLTVWLTADVAILHQRLMSDAPDQRPSLTGEGLLEELETVLKERLPLYASVADITIATDERSVNDIVKEIVAAYQSIKK